MAHQTAPTIGRLDLFKAWPVLIVAAGVVGTAAVDSFRLDAQAQDLATLSTGQKENAAAIQELLLAVAETNGNLELEIAKLQGQLKSLEQGDEATRLQLTAILTLLQGMARE